MNLNSQEDKDPLIGIGFSTLDTRLKRKEKQKRADPSIFENLFEPTDERNPNGNTSIESEREKLKKLNPLEEYLCN